MKYGPFVDDDDGFDPGMPTTCRCGRVVDFNDLVEDPSGPDYRGNAELICKACAEEKRGKW